MIKANKYSKTLAEIQKFFFTGVLSTALNFISYSIIFSFSDDIVISSITGYFLGTMTSFYFARSWIFKSVNQNLFSELIKFLVVYALSGIYMVLVNYFLFNFANFTYYFSWFIGVCVSIVNNFLCLKFWVFKATKS